MSIENLVSTNRVHASPLAHVTLAFSSMRVRRAASFDTLAPPGALGGCGTMQHEPCVLEESVFCSSQPSETLKARLLEEGEVTLGPLLGEGGQVCGPLLIALFFWSKPPCLLRRASLRPAGKGFQSPSRSSERRCRKGCWGVGGAATWTRCLRGWRAAPRLHRLAARMTHAR